MSGSSNQRLLKELEDKDARQVFVEEHARTGVAYQIKAMRDARGWSQEELGQALGGEPQSTISRWENPDYGRFTIGTLLRVAAAFDVALMVRFIGYGELVGRYSDLTPEALDAPSFSADAQIDTIAVAENTDHTSTHISQSTQIWEQTSFSVHGWKIASGNIVDSEYEEQDSSSPVSQMEPLLYINTMYYTQQQKVSL
jgi:transcriptional regulator with XRE-family HTH domain